MIWVITYIEFNLSQIAIKLILVLKLIIKENKRVLKYKYSFNKNTNFGIN